MSHAEVQADLTGERRGAAVSFATKEEAIAYIVSHTPRGTSLFDIAVVVNRSGDSRAGGSGHRGGSDARHRSPSPIPTRDRDYSRTESGPAVKYPFVRSEDLVQEFMGPSPRSASPP